MTSRILPIFAFFIAIAIFFFYVRPAWTGSIATTKAAIANDNQALATASEYTAKQNELASAENAINPADLSSLSTFLPNSVDNVGIILDLNALAARSGLLLTKADVAAGVNGADSQNSSASAAGAVPDGSQSNIGSISLSISASGTYAAFRSFLAGIEDSQRLLDMKSLSISGSNSGIYTYTMTIQLYWPIS